MSNDAILWARKGNITMVTGHRDLIANIERLHHVMDRANCAAIVVRSGKNVTYLSGYAYPGTLD